MFDCRLVRGTVDCIFWYVGIVVPTGFFMLEEASTVVSFVKGRYYGTTTEVYGYLETKVEVGMGLV